MLSSISQFESNINQYPFNVLNFESLNLNAPVVFFTGDNGSGKSTLMRAIGDLTGCISIGQNQANYYQHEKGFKVSWTRKLKQGSYFQSEDFFTYLSWANKEKEENRILLQEAQARHTNPNSLGYILETNLHRGNTQAMHGIVDTYMNASHGEGYIRFFSDRLRSNTLYLLDEPETPLSFQNQLSLIRLIDTYVKEGSQFIICTHSPILLAYPDALIYTFDDTIEPIQYDNHPIIQDYRNFLSDPQRYMHYLLKD